ncbi:MAG: hypothetical protein AAB352_04185 [Patescibacteria group bacterium]
MAIKISPLFFWWEWVKKVIWDPFWWVILFLIILWVPFLRVWWWLFLPIMLQAQLKILYIWWIDWDFSYAKAKWTMLEITPPKEVLVPAKGMEDVFAVVWPIWDAGNWRERWCDGELNNTPYWCSWEIASIEGKIHFYLRCLRDHRLSIETALYAHYPDIEVHEASDYTKLVPPTVPNEEWDMYGEDFILPREDPYPIKTYEKFFEPQGERISAEEKRIDPIISLLEGMSKLGPGENLWMQFITMPMLPAIDDPTFTETGQKIINSLSKRPEKKEPTFFEDLWYVAKQVILGPEKEGSGEKASYEWIPQQKEESGEREMVLTPGEREIITEVENKMKKALYKTVLRAVYVAKRENWVAPHRVMARSYFAHFSTQNMNRIQFSQDTRPKVHYILRRRRAFLRARRMMRNAVLRFPPAFPNRKKYANIFSAEELATLFHFPLRISGMVGPTMARVESKKSGPPPNLPTE